MVVLNIQALVLYCRNAGNPYLNDKCKRYVRTYKCVVIFWNLAFVTKIFLSTTGSTIADIEEQSAESDDFWYSIEQFVNIIFTEVIPFYCVLDNKFIKIMTMDFLEIDATGFDETNDANDLQVEQIDSNSENNL